MFTAASSKATRNDPDFQRAGDRPGRHRLAEMFIVRRIVQGEGVERKFPHPLAAHRRNRSQAFGHPRRAKLYYLRDLTGKAVRLRERRTTAEK